MARIRPARSLQPAKRGNIREGYRTREEGATTTRPPASRTRWQRSRPAETGGSGIRYRGPAPVTFDPPQTKVWEDYRDGGGSPWSAGWEPPPIPPGNRWSVRATFSAPGTYVLRCIAHDGGLQTYEDVTVRVHP